MILGTWIMLESQTGAFCGVCFQLFFFMFLSPCLVQLFRRMLRLQLTLQKGFVDYETSPDFPSARV